jgi:hypothetical protein
MTGTMSRTESLARTWRRAAAPRATRAASFAEGVMARYGRAAMRPGALLLVLARRTDAVTVNRFAGRTENHFGVTLQAVVVRHDVAAAAAESRAIPATASTAAQAQAGRARPGASHALPGMPGQDPADTLPSTAARVAGTAPAAFTPAAPAAPFPEMPPPSRPGPSTGVAPLVDADTGMPALRPRARPAEATAIDASMPTASPGPAAARPAAASPAPALPPQEIERIAERVLGSIDRRLLAERERRGRF